MNQLVGAASVAVLILAYLLIVQAMSAAVLLLAQFIIVQVRHVWQALSSDPLPEPEPTTILPYKVGGGLARWE